MTIDIDKLTKTPIEALGVQALQLVRDLWAKLDRIFSGQANRTAEMMELERRVNEFLGQYTGGKQP